MRKITMVLAGLAIIITSCSKWFEGDLEDQSVVLLSPIHNYSDSIQTKTFYWEELNDALEYELQVVSPSFDSLISFVLDTTIVENNFTHTFASGTYEWRVKALNSATETEYSYRTFSVLTVNNLSGQTIVLDFPTNQIASQDSVHEFSWASLESADQYLFRILDNTDGSEVYSTTITDNNVSYNFENDGQYRWTVQALNMMSASNTSESYITIDREAPLLPVLTSPEDMDTLSRIDIDFTWIQNATIVSSVFDSLYIDTDSNFVSPSVFLGTAQSLNIDSLDANTYYWKVRSFDNAGNMGDYSDFNTIVLE